MDLDLDIKTVGVSLAMWALCLVGIWFVKFGEGGFGIWQKVLLSICALPIAYIFSAYQINR